MSDPSKHATDWKRASGSHQKSPPAANRLGLSSGATIGQNMSSTDFSLYVSFLDRGNNMEHLDLLRVVTDAEYDARDNHPDKICHPGTRVDLLQEVQAWVQSPTSPPVFWLYAMAGHGKSTIARTVAKQFDEKEMLGATFFFKRGHAGRSSAENLFSTIAQQLARRRPELLPHVAHAIRVIIGEEIHKLRPEPSRHMAPRKENRKEDWRHHRISRPIVLDDDGTESEASVLLDMEETSRHRWPHGTGPVSLSADARHPEKDISFGVGTIEQQFNKLIVGPLEKSCTHSSKNQKLVVVLDALDECSAEKDIEVVVNLLRSLVKHKETGIKVFVTSSPGTAPCHGVNLLRGPKEELQFRILPFTSNAHDIAIVLRDNIRLAEYTWNQNVARFSEIKRIPPQCSSTSDIEELVLMTAARFDTAVAVCNFIRDLEAGSPLASLERLLNLRTEKDVQNFVWTLPAYSGLETLLPNYEKPGTDVSLASITMPSRLMIFPRIHRRPSVSEQNMSDAASVYSVFSGSSLIGIPHLNQPTFISYIGDNILNAIGGTRWLHAAFKYHSAGKIEEHLCRLLRLFSAALDDEVPSSDDMLSRTAIRSIQGRVCAEKITSHICQWERIWLEHVGPLDDVDRGHLPLMTGYQQLVQRKMGLFGKDSAERRPSNDGQRNADDNDGQENAVVLHPLQKMLFGGPAFAELCSAIKNTLYVSDALWMRHIEKSIQHSLSSLPPKVCKNCQLVEPSPTQDSDAQICADHAYPYSVTLQTDWKALDFLHAEFEKEVPSLGAVITYTGLASKAFATTCSQYLRKFWPSNSTALLDALDSLLLSRRTSKIGQSNEKTALPATPPKYALKARLSDIGEISIDAHGTAEFLEEVAQQLAWITSALRSSASGKNMHVEYSPILEDDTPEEENASRLKYCFATILPTSEANADGSSGGDPNFAMRCHFQEVPDAERSCWFGLVSGGAVIAADFPVPARGDEKGLEIPMGILAKIAVIQDAIEYKGGIVMKGPTSMLVPVKRNTDLNIIQWHVVSASKKGKRLTYIEGVEKCKQRALIDEVDLESFLRSRAIVGWWDHAKSRLGDEDINFTNLRWSTAEPYEPLRIQNIAAGLQNIGVLNIECAPGRKDSGYLVKFEGPYSEMLSTAKGEKAFLYDTLQQRAWLVTWDEVILHIIRKRNSDRPFVHNGAPVKIPTMGPAMQTLFLNQKLVLVDDEDKPETLRLTAIRIFNQLETLAAIDDNRRQAPEKAIDVPGVLIGHEFMSIVDRTVGRETKKNEIKLTSGGWTRLVRHSASLVLFANGFDDLICATANTENLCTRWKTVPWGKDYLAATTDTLLRLYFRGNEGSQEYLTSKGLCWHKRHSVKLFESCPEPASNKCGCSRLQQIVPKSMSKIGAVDRPRTVSAGGAVIFGTENAITKGPLSTVLRAKKDASIYSQPNLQIEGKVTCEDDALNSFKEDNTVFQPLGIECGSMTTVQKDRTSPSSKVRTKEVWIKRTVEAEGNGPVGKRQRY